MSIEKRPSSFPFISTSHVLVVVVVWFLLTQLTLIHALQATDREPHRERTIAVTTLMTPTGPMIGAISRRFESGCLEFSLSLLPVCGSLLALGLTAQWFIPRTTTRSRIGRLLLWTVGWFAWFLGGLLSLLNALS